MLAGVSNALAVGAQATLTILGKQSTIGPIASVGAGCASFARSGSATVATANLNGVATTGVITSTFTNTRTSTTSVTDSTSTITNVSALGGLITATAVKADDTVTATSGGVTNDFSKSSFTNLKVLGLVVPLPVAPNTTIALPGIGKVILNQQSLNKTGFIGGRVIMIDIVVTTTNILLGVTAGDRILLAEAESGFTATSVPNTVSAGSYGVFAKLLNSSNPLLTVGPLGQAGIPCTGGSGAGSVASVNLSPLIILGAITDTANGTFSRTGANARSQSIVATTNLLNGAIRAGVITANASATSDSGHGSHNGSTSILNLSINGTPFTGNIPTNTRITLPGLGVVYLNEEFGTVNGAAASQTTNAIHVVITTANSLGIPVGGQIIVGHTDAAVNPQ